MLGSGEGFLDIPSEALEPPKPQEVPPPAPVTTTTVPADKPRRKSSKTGPLTSSGKGWGWLKDYPFDLSKLNIHALATEMGLAPGPLTPYSDGNKFRLHCFLHGEHTEAVDDDGAVVIEKQGEVPTFHCSHSSHTDTLGLRDLLEAAGTERIGRFAPSLNQGGLPKMPNGSLRMTTQGLYFFSNTDDSPPLFLCGAHTVEAMVRDAYNGEWGVIFSWMDPDGLEHREPILRRQLAGDGVETRANLLAGGFRISSSPKARGLFTDYLVSVEAVSRVRMVSKIGWATSTTFVLPDITIGGDPAERTLFSDGHQGTHHFRAAGTLEEWQEQVGRRCIGNSRLVMAVAAGVAAPLLSGLQIESGGVHFKGGSSTGKSTTLFAVGSFWGGGNQAKGFLNSWRATSNGLEGTALAHNDCLLLLDEIGEIDGAKAGETAYMLANGQQKSRARSDGSPRPVNTWTLLFLSTGEQSLSDKMGEAGQVVKVGQEIRLLEIPADAGHNLGMFENLHGAPDGATFADQIRQASLSYYGTPARSYLEALIQDRPHALAYVSEHMATFTSRHMPGGSDGQVQRVVRRFALIAAAGELGIKLGILPWPQGEALKGVAACLDAWLSERGGNGPAEVQKGIQQVLRFLQTQGSSRFEDAWDKSSTFRATNRAGFRRHREGRWEYYLFPEVFKKEACKGFNATQIAMALVEAGHLQGGSGKTSRSVNIPKQFRGRMYYFPALPVEGEATEGLELSDEWDQV